MVKIIHKSLSIKELENAEQVMQICKENDVPIFLTNNDKNELVLMNIKVYEQIIVKMQVASLVNESLSNINAGGSMINGEDFFISMNKKYNLK